jgi:hypothetical protein
MNDFIRLIYSTERIYGGVIDMYNKFEIYTGTETVVVVLNQLVFIKIESEDPIHTAIRIRELSDIDPFGIWDEFNSSIVDVYFQSNGDILRFNGEFFQINDSLVNSGSLHSRRPKLIENFTNLNPIYLGVNVIVVKKIFDMIKFNKY